MRSMKPRGRVRTWHLALATALLAALAIPAMAIGGADKVKSTTFPLFVNGANLNCLKAPGQTPTVSATVKRGKTADQLNLTLSGFKPGLQFDLFTVEHSNQLANGSPDPAFHGSFGMAWYQSDIEAKSDGTAKISIKTILLDQIFGFDADTGLNPTNTFNLGFWFNNPADAAACGFTGHTPFNGEHQAGPLAFITRPNATTKLGPLCTDPVSAGGGAFTCNP
jgi:hypothetical protein